MKKTNRKDYFDINSLIAKGINDVRVWQLPIGSILYRPLSQLEMQQAEATMITSIQDIPTRKYILERFEAISEVNETENVEEEETKLSISDLPPEVNIAEFFNAQTARDIRLVYLSIKDYTDDFDEDSLMKFDGIRELAEEILRISGSTPESRADVKSFR